MNSNPGPAEAEALAESLCEEVLKPMEELPEEEKAAFDLAAVK
jgi:hypothetical protein